MEYEITYLLSNKEINGALKMNEKDKSQFYYSI